MSIPVYIHLKYYMYIYVWNRNHGVAIFVKPPCHLICRLALLHSAHQLYLVEYGLQHGLDALLPGTLGT